MKITKVIKHYLQKIMPNQQQKVRRPQTSRYQYIKKVRNDISPKKRVPIQRVDKIGILYAERDEKGLLKVGWSLIKNPDVFTREEGLILAKERASYDWQKTLPVYVQRQMPCFIENSERYLNGRWIGQRHFCIKNG